jgi:hypothetical protein
MDRDKQRLSKEQFNSMTKTWLLVVPLIVGIMGSAIITSLWLVSRSQASPETSYQVSSVDKSLLDNIRSSFRSTYLQFLQARIDPESELEEAESLEQRLRELVLEERRIISKYDSDLSSDWPSATELFMEILLEMPYPIMFTISLVLAILLFVVARYTAFFIINKRYSPDYIREV